ncbi:hypothetical protein [Halarcobacter bivalviorum]|uniref:Uncharacterized protein n=1 Tax=Halarcobacter bivalviorum TaxID=663364 RepID=A0AAX2A991_9BACT|nr:hypothetical protein [Halarcobacter bivalviorum]AXH12590.1 hypothetical protein ABIV_1600 [Halarcobacter bivalviorum]RXK10485.1 hypothetical protein CRV05_04195 [Halarcobacter bivalviorum]
MENTQNNTLEFQIGVTANTNEDNFNDIEKYNSMEALKDPSLEENSKRAIGTGLIVLGTV